VDDPVNDPAARSLSGRTNQKERTRNALKAAAAELMRGGVTPSIAQVANTALVSRSTAYRYFPTREALVAEVTLDEIVGPELDELHRVAQTPGSAADRVDAVIRADHALVTKHQRAFRAALRAIVDPRGNDPGAVPTRPGNRLRYLAEALAPLESELSRAQRERLVAALALCAGIESLVVTQDVCGLSSRAAESLKRWVAAALVEAALRESAD
jgi:AcrR family transcriptional regulator